MKALIGIAEQDRTVSSMHIDDLRVHPPRRTAEQVLAHWSSEPVQLRGLLQAGRVHRLSRTTIRFSADDSASAPCRRFDGAKRVRNEAAFLAEARAQRCEIAALYRTDGATPSPEEAVSRWTVWEPWTDEVQAAALRAPGPLARIVLELSCAQQIFAASRDAGGKDGQAGRREARQLATAARNLCTAGRGSALRDACLAIGASTAPDSWLRMQVLEGLEQAIQARQRVANTEDGIAEALQLLTELSAALDTRIANGNRADRDMPGRTDGQPAAASARLPVEAALAGS